eukprot:Cvel_18080.t1-p1 / transcript=Cvel_18080.t1 / gene=Cvel_18080 / organism=Chromera_velia_CCMP2878 / gene_product=30S ribosomal protein S1, putative / transcript_product=30S ribosomal protein S1, putative / location=Cvel_scaffold1479:5340-45641(+) / protein_length=4840 / sequence_SO=supercontig / SO=protein_coding / is_pseudo=false
MTPALLEAESPVGLQKAERYSDELVVPHPGNVSPFLRIPVRRLDYELYNPLLDHCYECFKEFAAAMYSPIERHEARWKSEDALQDFFLALKVRHATPKLARDLENVMLMDAKMPDLLRKKEYAKINDAFKAFEEKRLNREDKLTEGLTFEQKVDLDELIRYDAYKQEARDKRAFMEMEAVRRTNKNVERMNQVLAEDDVQAFFETPREQRSPAGDASVSAKLAKLYSSWYGLPVGLRQNEKGQIVESANPDKHKMVETDRGSIEMGALTLDDLEEVAQSHPDLVEGLTAQQYLAARDHLMDSLTEYETRGELAAMGTAQEALGKALEAFEADQMMARVPISPQTSGLTELQYKRWVKPVTRYAEKARCQLLRNGGASGDLKGFSLADELLGPDGFAPDGLDKEGYDRDGYDAEGIDRKGVPRRLVEITAEEEYKKRHPTKEQLQKEQLEYALKGGDQVLDPGARPPSGYDWGMTIGEEELMRDRAEMVEQLDEIELARAQHKYFEGAKNATLDFFKNLWGEDFDGDTSKMTPREQRDLNRRKEQIDADNFPDAAHFFAKQNNRTKLFFFEKDIGYIEASKAAEAGVHKRKLFKGLTRNILELPIADEEAADLGKTYMGNLTLEEAAYAKYAKYGDENKDTPLDVMHKIENGVVGSKTMLDRAMKEQSDIVPGFNVGDMIDEAVSDTGVIERVMFERQCDKRREGRIKNGMSQIQADDEARLEYFQYLARGNPHWIQVSEDLIWKAVYQKYPKNPLTKADIERELKRIEKEHPFVLEEKERLTKEKEEAEAEGLSPPSLEGFADLDGDIDTMEGEEEESVDELLSVIDEDEEVPEDVKVRVKEIVQSGEVTDKEKAIALMKELSENQLLRDRVSAFLLERGRSAPSQAFAKSLEAWGNGNVPWSPPSFFDDENYVNPATDPDHRAIQYLEDMLSPTPTPMGKQDRDDERRVMSSFGFRGSRDYGRDKEEEDAMESMEELLKKEEREEKELEEKYEKGMMDDMDEDEKDDTTEETGKATEGKNGTEELAEEDGEDEGRYESKEAMDEYVATISAEVLPYLLPQNYTGAQFSANETYFKLLHLWDLIDMKERIAAGEDVEDFTKEKLPFEDEFEEPQPDIEEHDVYWMNRKNEIFMSKLYGLLFSPEEMKEVRLPNGSYADATTLTVDEFKAAQAQADIDKATRKNGLPPGRPFEAPGNFPRWCGQEYERQYLEDYFSTEDGRKGADVLKAYMKDGHEVTFHDSRAGLIRKISGWLDKKADEEFFEMKRKALERTKEDRFEFVNEELLARYKDAQKEDLIAAEGRPRVTVDAGDEVLERFKALREAHVEAEELLATLVPSGLSPEAAEAVKSAHTDEGLMQALAMEPEGSTGQKALKALSILQKAMAAWESSGGVKSGATATESKSGGALKSAVDFFGNGDVKPIDEVEYIQLAKTARKIYDTLRPSAPAAAKHSVQSFSAPRDWGLHAMDEMVTAENTVVENIDPDTGRPFMVEFPSYTVFDPRYGGPEGAAAAAKRLNRGPLMRVLSELLKKEMGGPGRLGEGFLSSVSDELLDYVLAENKEVLEVVKQLIRRKNYWNSPDEEQAMIKELNAKIRGLYGLEDDEEEWGDDDFEEENDESDESEAESVELDEVASEEAEEESGGWEEEVASDEDEDESEDAEEVDESDEEKEEEFDPRVVEERRLSDKIESLRDDFDGKREWNIKLRGVKALALIRRLEAEKKCRNEGTDRAAGIKAKIREVIKIMMTNASANQKQAILSELSEFGHRFKTIFSEACSDFKDRFDVSKYKEAWQEIADGNPDPPALFDVLEALEAPEEEEAVIESTDVSSLFPQPMPEDPEELLSSIDLYDEQNDYQDVEEDPQEWSDEAIAEQIALLSQEEQKFIYELMGQMDNEAEDEESQDTIDDAGVFEKDAPPEYWEVKYGKDVWAEGEIHFPYSKTVHDPAPYHEKYPDDASVYDPEVQYQEAKDMRQRQEAEAKAKASAGKRAERAAEAAELEEIRRDVPGPIPSAFSDGATRVENAVKAAGASGLSVTVGEPERPWVGAPYRPSPDEFSEEEDTSVMDPETGEVDPFMVEADKRSFDEGPASSSSAAPAWNEADLNYPEKNLDGLLSDLYARYGEKAKERVTKLEAFSKMSPVQKHESLKKDFKIPLPDIPATWDALEDAVRADPTMDSYVMELLRDAMTEQHNPPEPERGAVFCVLPSGEEFSKDEFISEVLPTGPEEGVAKLQQVVEEFERDIKKNDATLSRVKDLLDAVSKKVDEVSDEIVQRDSVALWHSAAAKFLNYVESTHEEAAESFHNSYLKKIAQRKEEILEELKVQARGNPVALALKMKLYLKQHGCPESLLKAPEAEGPGSVDYFTELIGKEKFADEEIIKLRKVLFANTVEGKKLSYPEGRFLASFYGRYPEWQKHYNSLKVAMAAMADDSAAYVRTATLMGWMKPYAARVLKVLEGAGILLGPDMDAEYFGQLCLFPSEVSVGTVSWRDSNNEVVAKTLTLSEVLKMYLEKATPKKGKPDPADFEAVDKLKTVRGFFLAKALQDNPFEKQFEGHSDSFVHSHLHNKYEREAKRAAVEHFRREHIRERIMLEQMNKQWWAEIQGRLEKGPMPLENWGDDQKSVDEMKLYLAKIEGRNLDKPDEGEKFFPNIWGEQIDEKLSEARREGATAFEVLVLRAKLNEDRRRALRDYFKKDPNLTAFKYPFADDGPPMPEEGIVEMKEVFLRDPIANIDAAQKMILHPQAQWLNMPDKYMDFEPEKNGFIRLDLMDVQVPKDMEEDERRRCPVSDATLDLCFQIIRRIRAITDPKYRQLAMGFVMQPREMRPQIAGNEYIVDYVLGLDSSETRRKLRLWEERDTAGAVCKNFPAVRRLLFLDTLVQEHVQGDLASEDRLSMLFERCTKDLSLQTDKAGKPPPGGGEAEPETVKGSQTVSELEKYVPDLARRLEEASADAEREAVSEEADAALHSLDWLLDSHALTGSATPVVFQPPTDLEMEAEIQKRLDPEAYKLKSDVVKLSQIEAHTSNDYHTDQEAEKAMLDAEARIKKRNAERGIVDEETIYKEMQDLQEHAEKMFSNAFVHTPFPVPKAVKELSEQAAEEDDGVIEIETMPRDITPLQLATHYKEKAFGEDALKAAEEGYEIGDGNLYRQYEFKLAGKRMMMTAPQACAIQKYLGEMDSSLEGGTPRKEALIDFLSKYSQASDTLWEEAVMGKDPKTLARELVGHAKARRVLNAAVKTQSEIDNHALEKAVGELKVLLVLGRLKVDFVPKERMATLIHRFRLHKDNLKADNILHDMREQLKMESHDKVTRALDRVRSLVGPYTTPKSTPLDATPYTTSKRLRDMQRSAWNLWTQEENAEDLETGKVPSQTLADTLEKYFDDAEREYRKTKKRESEIWTREADVLRAWKEHILLSMVDSAEKVKEIEADRVRTGVRDSFVSQYRETMVRGAAAIEELVLDIPNGSLPSDEKEKEHILTHLGFLQEIMQLVGEKRPLSLKDMATCIEEVRDCVARKEDLTYEDLEAAGVPPKRIPYALRMFETIQNRIIEMDRKKISERGTAKQRADEWSLKYRISPAKQTEIFNKAIKVLRALPGNADADQGDNPVWHAYMDALPNAEEIDDKHDVLAMKIRKMMAKISRLEALKKRDPDLSQYAHPPEVSDLLNALFWLRRNLWKTSALTKIRFSDLDALGHLFVLSGLGYPVDKDLMVHAMEISDLSKRVKDLSADEKEGMRKRARVFFDEAVAKKAQYGQKAQMLKIANEMTAVQQEIAEKGAGAHAALEKAFTSGSPEGKAFEEVRGLRAQLLKMDDEAAELQAVVEETKLEISRLPKFVNWYKEGLLESEKADVSWWLVNEGADAAQDYLAFERHDDSLPREFSSDQRAEETAKRLKTLESALESGEAASALKALTSQMDAVKDQIAKIEAEHSSSPGWTDLLAFRKETAPQREKFISLQKQMEKARAGLSDPSSYSDADLSSLMTDFDNGEIDMGTMSATLDKLIVSDLQHLLPPALNTKVLPTDSEEMADLKKEIGALKEETKIILSKRQVAFEKASKKAWERDMDAYQALKPAFSIFDLNEGPETSPFKDDLQNEVDSFDAEDTDMKTKRQIEELEAVPGNQDPLRPHWYTDGKLEDKLYQLEEEEARHQYSVGEFAGLFFTGQTPTLVRLGMSHLDDLMWDDFDTPIRQVYREQVGHGRAAKWGQPKEPITSLPEGAGPDGPTWQLREMRKLQVEDFGGDMRLYGGRMRGTNPRLRSTAEGELVRAIKFRRGRIGTRGGMAHATPKYMMFGYSDPTNEELNFSYRDFISGWAEHTLSRVGSDRNFGSGAMVRGTVIGTAKKGRQILVDIGLKIPATLSPEEVVLEDIYPEERFLSDRELFAKRFPRGRKLFFEVKERRDMDVQLTLRNLQMWRGWERLAAAQQADHVVSGWITKASSGGVYISVLGIEAFCPISQVSPPDAKPDDSWLGRQVNVKVSELSLKTKRVIVSMRRAETQMQMETIRRGDLINGVVVAHERWGLFVTMGPTKAIIPLSKFSSMQLDDMSQVSEVLPVGAKIKAILTDYDPVLGRVVLSTRELERNPGEMLRNPQACFEAAVVRQKQLEEQRAVSIAERETRRRSAERRKTSTGAATGPTPDGGATAIGGMMEMLKNQLQGIEGISEQALDMEAVKSDLEDSSTGVEETEEKKQPVSTAEGPNEEDELFQLGQGNKPIRKAGFRFLSMVADAKAEAMAKKADDEAVRYGRAQTGEQLYLDDGEDDIEVEDEDKDLWSQIRENQISSTEDEEKEKEMKDHQKRSGIDFRLFDDVEEEAERDQAFEAIRMASASDEMIEYEAVASADDWMP